MMIPIVFATDDNYAHGAAVAIYSLLINADKSADYKIYIFTEGLTDESMSIIKKITDQFNNAKLEFVNIKDKLDKIEFKFCENMPSHLNVAMMYRLFIPQILSQYEKIIYLDVDIIVLGDIKELYDIDIGDNIIGAVKPIDYVAKLLKDYVENTLKIKYTNYYNSGVLVFNSKQFIKENGTKKSVDLLLSSNPYLYPDQDALNLFTNNKTAYYDLKWNKPMRDISIEEKSPNIIHYLNFFKPWYFLTSTPCCEIFWEYAEKAGIKNEVIQISVQQKRFENYFISSDWNMNFDIMERNSKIILYGGAEKGFYYRKQIEITNYYNMIMHVDKNYESLNQTRRYIGANYTVNPPEDILKVTDYDYIFITAQNESTINAIKADLLKLGVDINKVRGIL